MLLVFQILAAPNSKLLGHIITQDLRGRMSKKFELFLIGLVQPEFVGCGGSWVLLVITANLFKTTVLLHHLSLPCYIRAPSNGHIPAIQAFNYLKHVITTTPVLALLNKYLLWNVMVILALELSFYKLISMWLILAE